MKLMTISIALFSSLAIHILALSLWTPDLKTISMNPRTSPSTKLEIQASQAFIALDNERKFDSAMDQILSEIPKVDFSDAIKIPKPEPDPVTKTKPKKNQPKSEKATEESSNKTSGNNKPAAHQTAQPSPTVRADFGGIVKATIIQNIKLPANLPRQARGARAIISISFKNGQVAGFGLAQSSGFGEIDSAIINGVKRARFPKAPDDMSYNIPISIN